MSDMWKADDDKGMQRLLNDSWVYLTLCGIVIIIYGLIFKIKSKY